MRLSGTLEHKRHSVQESSYHVASPSLWYFAGRYSKKQPQRRSTLND